jgi:hypothetical protein
VGLFVEPGDAIAADRLLARGNASTGSGFASMSAMIRGRDEGLALLAFSPLRRSDDRGEWTVEDDGSNVLLVSPVLADLAPGAIIPVHFALVALGNNDTQITRAVQAARRTVLGDGAARMIPPPVSLTATVGDAIAPPRDEIDYGGDTPRIDSFWMEGGRLEDVLLAGSPNPFRDATTIEYEVPTHTLDEDGVEHVISGGAVPTSVKVYNVAGRLVATLVESPHGPGRYRTGWTARTDEGEAVASGVYYVKLTIGKRSVTKRLVQLK